MSVQGQPEIEQFANLKISIRGLNGVILPEDLYVKVTEVNQ